MENFDILSAGGFLFFLLIVTLGYIIVEIIIGEKYPFKKQIKENNNSALDRFIHYVVVGIFSNIVLFIILYYAELSVPFSETFESSGALGKIINDFFGTDVLSFQLIWTGVFYFIFIVILLFCGRFLIPYLIGGILDIIDYFIKELRQRKIKKQKKLKKSKK
ncbi:hypothetical protein LAT59_02920 [Candidatus Gracilibacteria bacterium]|nr:hypothetical protein [Candidatus Gracilibacteria bacterium]